MTIVHKGEDNFLYKDYKLENIQEFYDGIEKSPNSLFTKLLVWSRFKRDLNKTDEEKAVEEIYKKDSSSFYTVEKITDDFFICCYNIKGMSPIYTPYIDGKRVSMHFDSFDKAIIAGLSVRYTGKTDAVDWVVKLLDMDKNKT